MGFSAFLLLRMHFMELSINEFYCVFRTHSCRPEFPRFKFILFLYFGVDHLSLGPSRKNLQKEESDPLPTLVGEETDIMLVEMYRVWPY